MNNPGQYYDPAQMSTKLRDMLMKGDTSDLPNFIQQVLAQSIANPLTQALLAPLAQSLAAPLSQYFSGTTGQDMKSEPVVQQAYGTAGINSLNPQIFEIHGYVVVRTFVPEDVSEKDIKVLITDSHVTIKGDPSDNDHILPLPQGAKKAGAKAAFRDRVLEIRIPKDNTAITADEISVEYL